MQRVNDKYGRGSAAVNGAGFVDLEPGDTFDRLDALLRGRITEQFENAMLGLRASIASKRNANELAKHLAYGEKEEAHKFAVKNIGVLFERGGVAIRHLDKKAAVGQRWVVVYVRVFSSFVFADRRFLATITLKETQKGAGNIYAVEALEINQDADSERTPRGAIPKGLNSAPIQNLASQLIRRIAYYVGDVNRTKPTFLACSEAFSVETTAELVLNAVLHQPPTTNHQPPITNHQSPTTNITVIILIGQEKIHLKRCVEKLALLNPRQIFLVESQPDDGGVVIAKETAAKLGLRLESKFNKWPGTQARQFNWALENLPIEAGWILRLDADEYLLPELIEEIREELPRMNNADGVVLKRRHVVGWLGDTWVKRGMYPTRILRLFRRGKGRSDMKLMDEHIVVDGKVVEFDHDFVDHSLISFEEWKAKHRGYAKREAQSYLSGEESTGEQAAKKAAYYKLPRYFRAVMYLAVRFFLKSAILEGPKAWRWCWWHALWYRWLVDVEIGRKAR